MQVKSDVKLASISLFSSSGIGDLGIEYGCDIPVILSAELLTKRCELIRHNYPKCRVISGDIKQTKNQIISNSMKILDGKRPLLMTLSPPCQGMSTTGAGKIASAVRKGKRPKHDDRNKLLIPGLEIINKLQPEFFLIENVPKMRNTLIQWRKNQPKKLIDLIKPKVGPGYEIHSFVVDFANYGVPHIRKRLITIGKRTGRKNTIFKLYEKGNPKWFDCGSKEEQISLKNAISYLSRSKHGDLYRQEPRMNERHVYWAKHIPMNSGKSAFSNNCAEEKCRHIESIDSIFCRKCKQLLPRPNIIDKKTGKYRLIKGRPSTYKRMLPDVPANTITMGSGIPSTDNSLHYSQNRVLNLREVMVLTSFCNIENKRKNIITDYPWHAKYKFDFIMKPGDYLIQKNIIRQSLGESIPPLAMQRMVKSLLEW